MSVLSKRLREVRIEAGLSQEALGVMAGIEEASASARMNQYERGKHEPDFSMVERIAKVLNVPESYFYSKDDDTAWLTLQFHRLKASKRKLLIEFAKDLAK